MQLIDIRYFQSSDVATWEAENALKQLVSLRLGYIIFFTGSSKDDFWNIKYENYHSLLDFEVQMIMYQLSNVFQKLSFWLNLFRKILVNQFLAPNCPFGHF